LRSCFADPARLALAAPALSAAERAALRREPGGWTAADVPLLDEAGRASRAGRAGPPGALGAANRRSGFAYARGVLDIAAGSGDPSDEVASAWPTCWTPGKLAARHEAPDHQTMAERAAADRNLDVRARDRGRGPGALADGLAACWRGACPATSE